MDVLVLRALLLEVHVGAPDFWQTPTSYCLSVALMVPAYREVRSCRFRIQSSEARSGPGVPFELLLNSLYPRCCTLLRCRGRDKRRAEQGLEISWRYDTIHSRVLACRQALLSREALQLWPCQAGHW